VPTLFTRVRQKAVVFCEIDVHVKIVGNRNLVACACRVCEKVRLTAASPCATRHVALSSGQVPLRRACALVARGFGAC
jgi:hypothetical protein